jgi:Polyketide cyclase / dehydrase and lipid transport
MLGFGAAKPVSGHAESVVKSPGTKIYDFVASNFFDNYQKWCPQVVELEMLSEPPIRPGTMGRQVTHDRGIDSESTFVVTDFAPPQRLEIRGIFEPFRTAYEFARETDASTRVAFTFELKELDLVMRPFQKLIRTALQEGAVQTVENIKRLVEGGAPQAFG